MLRHSDTATLALLNSVDVLPLAVLYNVRKGDVYFFFFVGISVLSLPRGFAGGWVGRECVGGG